MSSRPRRTFVTKRRILASVITVAVVGTAVAVTVPALAGTTEPPGSAGALFDAEDPGVTPLVVGAVGRDLTMTPEQVHARLRKERWASRTEPQLRASLGSQFAGAWFAPGTEQLTVGVTSDDAAARVRKAGAEPKRVTHAESELDGFKAKLDDNASRATRSITGWYTDVTTNTVVVVAKPGAEDSARSLATASGVPEQVVRIVTSSDSPTPLYDVRGADAFYINSTGRCSIGFAVTGGFVTAGHCGKPGATTAGANRAAQGTFKASSFPGNDYAYVTVNSNWTPTGVVNDYDGGTVTVAGSEEAPVGATVCRSGSTTGTHCGLVQAKNATVNYAEGTVTGLTRTSVCAEPGRLRWLVALRQPGAGRDLGGIRKLHLWWHDVLSADQ